MSLRDIRLASGLSIQALANKSGVHRVKISQIEAGKIKPENISLHNAIRLAEALDCHPRDFLH